MKYLLILFGLSSILAVDCEQINDLEKEVDSDTHLQKINDLEKELEELEQFNGVNSACLKAFKFDYLKKGKVHALKQFSRKNKKNISCSDAVSYELDLSE